MRHHVIIPHRNRHRHLRLCLKSIVRAAAFVRDMDFRVVLVEPTGGWTSPPEKFDHPWLTRIPVDVDMPIFNKTTLLNAGITWAIADGAGSITILDADAHVGPRWLECFRLCEVFDRLAYRVRYLPEEQMNELEGDGWLDVITGYDTLPLGFEAYGRPLMKRFDPTALPWGNSQMTVRTDVLGDLRFDERFVGRGFEDLAFSRALRVRQDRRRHDSAFIFTDAAHALIHIRHGYASDWRTPETRARNLALFQGRA